MLLMTGASPAPDRLRSDARRQKAVGRGADDPRGAHDLKQDRDPPSFVHLDEATGPLGQGAGEEADLLSLGEPLTEVEAAETVGGRRERLHHAPPVRASASRLHGRRRIPRAPVAIDPCRDRGKGRGIAEEAA
jgi:hypothetical protein